MTKKQQPSEIVDPKDASGTKEIAFSVRLTPEEHEQLKQAATVRGWTPTNLIRTAALERARHVLNTSRVTTLDFKGLAMRVAEKLFKPRTYQVKWVIDEGQSATSKMSAYELEDLGENPETVSGVVPDQAEFPIKTLEEFRKAVKYGGGEFLNQILE